MKINYLTHCISQLIKFKSMFHEQTKLTSKKIDNFLNQDKKISFGIGVSRNNHQEEIKSFEFLFK